MGSKVLWCGWVSAIWFISSGFDSVFRNRYALAGYLRLSVTWLVSPIQRRILNIPWRSNSTSFWMSLIKFIIGIIRFSLDFVIPDIIENHHVIVKVLSIYYRQWLENTNLLARAWIVWKMHSRKLDVRSVQNDFAGFHQFQSLILQISPHIYVSQKKTALLQQ